ncbi:MAG: 50S ribosomal protein L31 [bacterium]
MKKKTHPDYYPEAQVTCVCGNAFKIGSTQPELKVEICSACHPFYTGKQKLVDTARRVDKFKKKMEQKTTKVTSKKTKRATRNAKKIEKGAKAETDKK